MIIELTNLKFDGSGYPRTFVQCVEQGYISCEKIHVNVDNILYYKICGIQICNCPTENTTIITLKGDGSGNLTNLIVKETIKEIDIKLGFQISNQIKQKNVFRELDLSD